MTPGRRKFFGAGQGSEVLVGGGDIVLPVGLADAAAGAGDLGGEEAGPVEVEEGAEAVAEEGVELGDEIVGDADVAEPRVREAEPESLEVGHVLRRHAQGVRLVPFPR